MHSNTEDANCQFYFEGNWKDLTEEFKFVEAVFQLMQKNVSALEMGYVYVQFA